MKKLILFLGMVALFATTFGQATVVGTTAGAKIIATITLTMRQPLHFGTMAVLSSSSGTCQLTTSNVRTATGGVNLSAAAPISQVAIFDVTGEATVWYVITLPSSITISDGSGHNMIITSLACRPNSEGADQLNGQLSAGGADYFSVGGLLSVGAAQAPGAYSGTFDVTVAYY